MTRRTLPDFAALLRALSIAANVRVRKAPIQLCLLFAMPLPAIGQMPPIDSHQIDSDGRLTVRYKDQVAQDVKLGVDWAGPSLAMDKGDGGVWSVKTPPLLPGLHVYQIQVDGSPVFDPYNRETEPNFVLVTNEVTVPGPPQLWDLKDVPHGTVHHHSYRTNVIKGLPNSAEDFYVYTPPGYRPAETRHYPVLYLLHGWGSPAEAWIHSGKANLIIDNLIAEGKAVPMIVVMPLGYGDMEFVSNGWVDWRDEARVSRNLSLFAQALITEIIPRVETAYNASTDKRDRAIAGLSMGGGQSLIIGLGHPELFDAVAGFSGSLVIKKFETVLPSLSSHFEPRVLWVSYGLDEARIEYRHHFTSWLISKGLAPTVVETPGFHNWLVWRDNFVHFAPLLFRR